MDKRNQGQKTACAKFGFMDMLLARQSAMRKSRLTSSGQLCQIRRL
jgi:hypothetical protein